MKTKSRKRNSTEGTIDKITGRVLEVVGKVTGNGKTKAKGKAARGRGTGRRTTGRTRATGRKGAKR
jgi:uncharacterized protein YjbJ (UPF0337 family)